MMIAILANRQQQLKSHYVRFLNIFIFFLLIFFFPPFGIDDNLKKCIGGEQVPFVRNARWWKCVELAGDRRYQCWCLKMKKILLSYFKTVRNMFGLRLDRFCFQNKKSFQMNVLNFSFRSDSLTIFVKLIYISM